MVRVFALADVADRVFRSVVLRFQYVADGAEAGLSRLVTFLEVLVEYGAGELGDAVFSGVEQDTHSEAAAAATTTASAVQINPTRRLVGTTGVMILRLGAAATAATPMINAAGCFVGATAGFSWLTASALTDAKSANKGKY
ncbi:MAG TPA: hypothetical protein VFZ59_22735 [Verrucomicrobiae bacterium]|nr:hypothetical protein [Verrucomicrobiae bacterium]